MPLEGGRQILDASALRADDRLAEIDDTELDRLLDPRNALGLIPRFIDSLRATDYA